MQKLLDVLIQQNESDGLDFTLYLQDNSYKLTEVIIANLPTSVTRPTTRGGVYFSEKSEYRISGVINDLSISPLLSKVMLGPNKEFGDIQICTNLHNDIKLNIHANLIRSVQDKSGIELHMILVELETI